MYNYKVVKLVAVLILMSLLVLTACSKGPKLNEETGGWVTSDVSPGEALLSPKEAGADYIEPHKYPYAMIEGIGFVDFSKRWNEAAKLLDRPEFVVDEFHVRYTVPNMRTAWIMNEDENNSNKDIEGFLSIDYETENIMYPGLFFSWGDIRDADRERLFDAWAVLVYATNNSLNSKKELEYTVGQMKDMKTSLYECENSLHLDNGNVVGSHIISMNNIKYEFWSEGDYGMFRVVEPDYFDDRSFIE